MEFIRFVAHILRLICTVAIPFLMGASAYYFFKGNPFTAIYLILTAQLFLTLISPTRK